MKVGDRVNTLDSGVQSVRWIGVKHFDQSELKATPKLRPICVARDAFAEGYPNRDLLVSRQHRFLIRSKIAQRMFNEAEILVAAIRLLPLKGVSIQEDTAPVSYFHLLFDEHEIVWANGALAESLYIGPNAVNALPPKSQKEIFGLFPKCGRVNPSLARPAPKGAQIRSLLERHQKNERVLYQKQPQAVS